MTPDEARQMVIDGMDYAAYRETDSSLHDSDRNRLFGSEHYKSDRPVYNPSPWPEGDFEAKMATLLAWANVLNRSLPAFADAQRLLEDEDSIIGRIIQRARQQINEESLQAHDIKLVVIQSFGSQFEAELATGVLEEAGIQAIIQGDTAGRMREHLAWSGAGFKVLVREDDAAKARDVLASPVEEDKGAGADADAESDDDSFPPWRRFS
jgi:Putative prokaryotic signal transducing protein